MDMTELWEKACMLLKGEMNEISYNTWIQSSLKPLSLEGDCLTLCTSAEYMKSMIASRYATLIANALGEVAGHPMQVEILTRAEVDKKQSQAEPEAPAGFTSMSLNPKYTFDTGIRQTIQWYLDNQDWWKNILSGEYSSYFDKMYGERLEEGEKA